tara:strand:- start:405 stop:596 length:192 start_codon:yes stop_codon:yes gene_type:complete
MKPKFLYVQPRSAFAQEVFEDYMNKLHSCKIEEEKENKMLVSSISGRYSFWINKEFDSNWEVL